jgi:IS30 family transposase
MAPLPAPLRRSLAWDQGQEMAVHGEIALALGRPVFFGDKAKGVAAVQQRNNRWAAAPVLPEGHRPARA